MRGPFVITAPWGTPEETAESYGIPKRRAAELKRMVEESLARKGFITLDGDKASASKNGASGAASGSRRKKIKVTAAAKRKSKSGNASRRKTTRAQAKTSR